MDYSKDEEKWDLTNDIDNPHEEINMDDYLEINEKDCDDSIWSLPPALVFRSSTEIFSQIKNDATISVFSWNCGGKLPDKNIDFNQFLDVTFQDNSKNAKSPSDIVVFGFQETIKLNIYNCMRGHNDNDGDKLINLLNDALDNYTEPGVGYEFVTKIGMVGLILIVFSKVKVSNVETTKVRTGFGGTVGNKGAVVARFEVNSIKVILIWAHLESGQDKTPERVKNIETIMDQWFSEHEEYAFHKHDVKILFGDLNFRIDMPYKKVIQKMNSVMFEDQENGFSAYKLSKMSQLLKIGLKMEVINQFVSTDQLIEAMSKYTSLYGFREMPIEFLPTYKYIEGTNILDDSSKKRIPSYWDRILWHDVQTEDEENDFVVPILYKRIENNFNSDHKAVAALFKLVKPVESYKREKTFVPYSRYEIYE